MTVKPLVCRGRVLVATDNLDDARLLLRQLAPDFELVHASTNGQRAVEDFEAYRPDVLVLAFDGLAKAQHYYEGLCRRSHIQHPHRTVILCNKDDAREVFELCKKQHFDDYVLYWPHAYDGSRLAMCIWNASREVAALRARFEVPGQAAWLAHTRNLLDLEHVLDRNFDDGQQRVAHARDSLQQVAQQIAGALDAFVGRLTDSGATRALGHDGRAVLQREIDQLKRLQVQQARGAGANVVEPLGDWAARFRDEIEPARAGARELAGMSGAIRPIVMVVDDDGTARTLVERMLDARVYDLRFAADATEALAHLRRERPDVVLMDVRLPGVDGVTLTKRMKCSPHLVDIPVIMMTGDARRETLEESMAAGAASFIVKPLSSASLGAKLEQVLRRRHAVSAEGMPGRAQGSCEDSRSSVGTTTGVAM